MTLPLEFFTEEEIQPAWPEEKDSGFGALQTDKGVLPLKAMAVQAQLEGLLAHVDLCQTFVNNLDVAVEATYIFPLPDRAAVTRFRMDVGDRVVEGVLQERGQARRTYDQSLQEGHRAAIAEEERSSVFTLRVGNLMAGAQARIRLTLSGPLVYDSGEVTFRFPLVVAPRYIPGKPLNGESVGSGTQVDTDQTPDASRISPPVLLPGYPNPVQLSLSVDITAADLPLCNFRCSLHSARLEQDDTGKVRITLFPEERLNRDFILRYTIGDNALHTSLVLAPDHPGTDTGTFLLTLVPPMNHESLPRPRDVVFVLDRSGSMMGWKMVAARRALAHMVDTLTAADRFTIFAFDDQLETPSFNNSTLPTEGGGQGGGLVPATNRNRHRAVEWLLNIEARGGTEMARPLDLAVKKLAGDRDRYLVLITDGQVGNEDHILKMLGTRLAGIRIFTLGIDQAVNEGFLKRLALLGGGCCDVVESQNRLDEVMYKLHRRINAPVLSNLQLDPGKLEIDFSTLTPSKKLDLFAGVPLLLQGRYRGSPTGTLTVMATDASGRPWSQKIEGRRSASAAVGVIWARARLRQLEDRYVIGDSDRSALEKQIVELSLRFGVLCRFTAFVAVDRSEKVNEGGQQQVITQPVEVPAGWEMLEAAAMPLVGTFVGSAGASYKARQVLASVPSAPAPKNAQGVSLPCRAGKDFEDNSGTTPESVVSYLMELDENADAPTQIDKSRCGQSHPPSPRKKERQAAPKPKGRFLSRLFGRGAKEPTEAVDLTAYRQRAAELLKMLQEATLAADDDRLRVLGALSVKLNELLDDMGSIGLDQTILKPLAKLHNELKTLPERKDNPPSREVSRLWTLAEKTLTAFVQGK